MAVEDQPMRPIVVRSGMPSNSRTVAAVWRASCSPAFWDACPIEQTLPLGVVRPRVERLATGRAEDVVGLSPEFGGHRPLSPLLLLVCPKHGDQLVGQTDAAL